MIRDSTLLQKEIYNFSNRGYKFKRTEFDKPWWNRIKFATGTGQFLGFTKALCSESDRRVNLKCVDAYAVLE